MNTPTPLNELHDSLLTEHQNIQSQLAPLQARLEEIEKVLRHLEPGKYTNGMFDLTVSPSKRFNKKQFTQDFPYEKNPHLYKQAAPEVDVKQIPPTVKEQYSDEYDNRITIK